MNQRKSPSDDSEIWIDTHDRPSLNLPVLRFHRPGSRLHPPPRDWHNRSRDGGAGDGHYRGGVLAAVEIRRWQWRR